MNHLEEEWRQLQDEQKRIKAEQNRLLLERNQVRAAQQAIKAKNEQLKAAWKKMVALQSEVVNKKRKVWTTVKTFMAQYAIQLISLLLIGMVFTGYKLSREETRLEHEWRRLRDERHQLLLERRHLLAAHQAIQAENKQTKAAWKEIVTLQSEFMKKVMDMMGNKGLMDGDNDWSDLMKIAMRVLDIAAQFVPLVKCFV